MKILRDIGQFIVIWFMMGFVFMLIAAIGGGLNNIPQDQTWVPFAACWGLSAIIVAIVGIGEVYKAIRERV